MPNKLTPQELEAFNQLKDQELQIYAAFGKKLFNILMPLSEDMDVLGKLNLQASAFRDKLLYKYALEYDENGVPQPITIDPDTGIMTEAEEQSNEEAGVPGGSANNVGTSANGPEQ